MYFFTASTQFSVLRARADEVRVVEALLLEDDVRHPVEDGDVRPRPELEMDVGVLAELDLAGSMTSEFRAAADRALDARAA